MECLVSYELSPVCVGDYSKGFVLYLLEGAHSGVGHEEKGVG